MCQSSGAKGKDQWVAYANRQLTLAECNYLTMERECLAIVFQHYFLCNPVIFFVDHVAIKFLVNKPEPSGRLARWVLLLEKLDFTVEYKPGRVHLQADHLSRVSDKLGIGPIDSKLVSEGFFVLTMQPK